MTTAQTLHVDSPRPHLPGSSATDRACRPPKDAAEEESHLDIEHVPVDDDPRKWSHLRKTITLWIVSTASFISTLASNIQNPANGMIKHDLHATHIQISWSLAAFIMVQGTFSLVWSATSEIKGRKPVYVVATSILVAASAILANSPTINVLIGMRVMQAAGSSAAISISAATLADIYETHERGKMMGIFYAAPLLGPALGPVLGGCLTHVFGWRSIFYFVGTCGCIILGAFTFLLSDTFRIERSLTYQASLGRRNVAQNIKLGVDSTAVENKVDAKEKQASSRTTAKPDSIEDGTAVTKVEPRMNDVRLSFSDINPFLPLYKVVQRKNNVAILLANGLVFALSYCQSYTCARALSMRYNYDALSVGVVLLSVGAGSIGGSLIGGRYSDYIMTKMRDENGGQWYAEMRLKSATFAMVWLPLSVVGYGWVAAKHIHVGAICLMLFLCGFFSIWIYACTLAYVVDANPGRSSSAVAANSSFRGALACVSTMVAIPLQDAVGDGWLYTGFAGLMVVMELLIVLVLYKGASWRGA